MPLSLAFGVSSGLGAIAGLYGAILVCLFATIFGGTKTQISGPTGPMTVVIASIIVTNPGNYKLIFATIFLAGLIQILLGLSKVGSFIKYVPYPVISGFMSGIGAIIVLLQLNSLLGLEFSGQPIGAIFNILKELPQIDLSSLILGVLTLVIVFFTPKKLTKVVPSTLIALVVVTAISILAKFNVATIGAIPQVFPSIKLGLISFSEFQIILPIAFTLGFLGAIDSLLTSLVADSLTKTKHKSNQELIGQGIGNIAASIFGGLAGAGATMRTVVNIKTGGRTRLSGIVHSIFLICVILFFAPLAAKIPLAVLAGILIKVGFDIIDYKILKIIKEVPKSDLVVMIVVFLITILDDLIFAVGVGIVLSSVMLAVKLTKQTNIEVEKHEDEIDTGLEEEIKDNIMIVRINGILFFGTAPLLLSRIDNLYKPEQIIIDCKKIKTMDISAIFALEDVILRLKKQHTKVMLVLNNRLLTRSLLSAGIDKVLPKENIVYDIDTAVEKLKS